MNNADILIIGGGLAGLTAAIHLAQKDLEVILLEKESFPHHKVCGEYVSKEILPYLEQLDIHLGTLNPPEVSRLFYSTAKGNKLEIELPLGGLGISRFAFDDFLFRKAKKLGVTVIKETVTEIEGENVMQVTTASGKNFTAKVVLGSFGKRSTLDKNLNRPFFRQQAPWLAVKSHYDSPGFSTDLVALHNFDGGYCGLSRTESGAVNVCYLATYESFRNFKDPEKFKKNVLRKNPFLDSFFSNATPIFEQPLTIAQISFNPKNTVHNHILMLGDAAGLLHPLCGNGMAMAIHSAKIASETVLKHLDSSSFDRAGLEKDYTQRWNKAFQGRIRTGKYLQNILLSPQLSELSQSIVSKVPFVLPQIIKRTHGKPIT